MTNYKDKPLFVTGRKFALVDDQASAGPGGRANRQPAWVVAIDACGARNRIQVESFADGVFCHLPHNPLREALADFSARLAAVVVSDFFSGDGSHYLH